MQLKRCTWIVLLVVALHVTSTAVAQFRSDDYFYLDPDMEYEEEWSPSLADGDADADADEPPNNFPFSVFPRSAVLDFNDPSFAMEATTECETEAPGGGRGGGPDGGKAGGAGGEHGGGESTRTSTPAANDTKPAGNKTMSQSAGSDEQAVATTCYPIPYPYQHQSTAAPGAATGPPSESATTSPPTSQSDSTTAKPAQSESTTSASAHAESTSSPPSNMTVPPGSNATAPAGVSTSTPAGAQSTETTTCIPEDAPQSHEPSTPPPSASTTSHSAATAIPPSGGTPSVEATTCISYPGGPRAAPPGSGSGSGGGGSPSPQSSSAYNGDQDGKAKELHQLVQHLYVAQARVQLEAIEIKKAQAVANSAQQQLEEAANHVRTVTAALQTAQQEVASAAIRAQTAQLQLAAHDQLLFAARQDVDALSSQMVGMQAAEGISAPSMKFDINGLLDKLKQPLTEGERPTPVPPMVAIPSGPKQVDRADDYYDYD